MPGNPLTDPNWAPNLADTVERVVTTVRDRTTKPLLTAYRGLVFGIIAAFGGVTALVLLIIGLVRGLQAIIEWPSDHRNAVWMSYFGIGVLFTAFGLLLLRKRYATTEPDE